MVEEINDFVTVSVELTFDLSFVRSEEANVLGSLLLFLLLDGRESPPSSSPGTNGVLVGNTQKISLLNAEIGVGTDDSIHAIKHVFESFSLLSDFGHIKVFFSAAGSHFLDFSN
jgi:hypothetical protein